MKKIGLTVGKYAPFHKGHQYLIETALSEMEALIIIVYNAPKSTDIPLNVRANWIRKLYPDVTVIEGWDVPTEEGWSEENQRRHESYIMSLVSDIQITAFYSSESYGERMSRALGCQNRIVDMARDTINICATDIRNDAFGFREYLDPIVYSDFVTNVFLFGDSDSGKTELSIALANAYDASNCLIGHGNTNAIRETDYEAHALEQNRIFLEKNYEAHRYLFSDHDLITMQLNFRNLYHKDNKTIETLIMQNRSRYDLVFVCESEVENRCNPTYKSTNVQLISELLALKIPFMILTGSLESKLYKVKRVLSHFTKFKNNDVDFLSASQNLILETDRLYLRKLKPSDFDSLCKIMQDPIAMVAYEHAFSDDEVKAWLLRQMERYDAHDCGLWAVILKSTDEMIGQCGITLQKWGDREIHEIGYLFQKAYWHQGYATEAAIGCKKYAFDIMGLTEIVSIIRDTNIASQNVAIRNGMAIVDQFIKHYQNIEMPHYVFLAKRNQ